MPYAPVGPAIDRHRIFYRLHGNPEGKIRVLFTMGLGGDHYQWQPQTEWFKHWGECQFCIYDNRGTGLSDTVSGRWTTRCMAQDAVDLLDHLDWKAPCSVHLVGLSMGGMITQEIAKLDPPRFGSIALLSTIAGGLTSLGLFLLKLPTGVLTMCRIFTTSDPRERLKRGLQVLYPAEFLEQQHSNDPKASETNEEVFRRALISRGRRAIADGSRNAVPLSTAVKQGLAVATHRLSQADLRALGDHFGPAVLIVTGDSDILVHPHNSTVLASPLDQSTLLTLPAAGHGANEQCAEEVNKAIKRNILRGVLRSRL